MVAEALDAVAARLLRRLSARASVLRRTGEGYRLDTDSGHAGERVPVPVAVVDVLRRRDLIVEDAGLLSLSKAGAAYLRRSLAGSEAYRAQHSAIETAIVTDDNGVPHQVAVDRGESPLSALRHRRGRDGRPLIDPLEFAAGERLRSDFERGRLMPRVTANWSAAVAAGRRDGGAGGMAELTEASLSARQRVERAVDALGPEFSGVLLDFCCFLKGLEEIERERQWPARSAKLVLRLGLGALARHYGLAAGRAADRAPPQLCPLGNAGLPAGTRMSRKGCRLRIGFDTVDERAETVRTLRGEVRPEIEPVEDRFGIGGEDFARRLVVEERQGDRDETADDERVAVADEMEDGAAVPLLAAGGEPHLTGAAANLVRLNSISIWQGRELPPKLDDIAIAVFPIVEKLEIRDCLVHRGHTA